jgi:uncharacterized protein (TIGR03435 family)
MRYWTTAALLVGLAMQLSAKTPTAQRPVEESRFDVASVRPLPTGSSLDDGGYYATPTRFSGKFSVRWLMRLAFDIPVGRIVEGPEWVRAEGYEINAVSSGTRPRGGLAFEIRHLLEERFNLKTHREQRPTSVLALGLLRSDGRLGRQLRRVERDCGAPNGGCGMKMPTKPGYSAVGQQWNELVAVLTGFVGQIVVDRTGLSGQFDVDLEWTPESARVDGTEPGTSDSADLTPPRTVFIAVQEQLGLKLEPRTEVMDVVVIDSIERPAPN